MTGGSGVDADLSWRQFESQSPGQCFDGSFRERIEQSSRHGMRTDDGTEVDDASALGTEVLDRFLHGENDSENVDIVVEVKSLFCHLGEGAEAEYPGIVN